MRGFCRYPETRGAMTDPVFALMTVPVEPATLAKRALPVALLVLFWCWETRRPFFGRREDRYRHAARNLAVAVFNTVVLALAFGSATAAVADWTERHESGLLNALDLGPALGFALALVLLDGWM